MTKATNWLCAQRRLRSAWASAQSDQSLRCPHEESLDPYLPIKCTAKTLIRLGGCPGWSESSLGAQSFCWFCHEVAHLCWHMHKCKELFNANFCINKIFSSLKLYVDNNLCVARSSMVPLIWLFIKCLLIKNNHALLLFPWSYPLLILCPRFLCVYRGHVVYWFTSREFYGTVDGT